MTRILFTACLLQIPIDSRGGQSSRRRTLFRLTVYTSCNSVTNTLVLRLNEQQVSMCPEMPLVAFQKQSPKNNLFMQIVIFTLAFFICLFLNYSKSKCCYRYSIWTFYGSYYYIVSWLMSITDYFIVVHSHRWIASPCRYTVITQVLQISFWKVDFMR